jgi:hypothetical protein
MAKPDPPGQRCKRDRTLKVRTTVNIPGMPVQHGELVVAVDDDSGRHQHGPACSGLNVA